MDKKVTEDENLNLDLDEDRNAFNVSLRTKVLLYVGVGLVGFGPGIFLLILGLFT